MHAAVQILMEDQGEQGPSETVQAISDEPRFVVTQAVSVYCVKVSKCSVYLQSNVIWIGLLSFKFIYLNLFNFEV